MLVLLLFILIFDGLWTVFHFHKKRAEQKTPNQMVAILCSALKDNLSKTTSKQVVWFAGFVRYSH